MRTVLWMTIGVLAMAAWAVAGPDAEPEKAAGTAPVAGDPAPACRLNDQAGKAVDLAAFGKGAWTIVAFFPKSFTPG
jgi:hypothetical protein